MQGGDRAPVQGRRLEEDCRKKVQRAGKSGWGLGFRCLVRGLSGPKKPSWAVSKARKIAGRRCNVQGSQGGV
jgi:hypothetical protein